MFLWLTVYIFRGYVRVNFVFWLQYLFKDNKMCSVRGVIVYLIFVELFINKFILSLLLKRDDDERDEDVDEEERKDDEVDDVEDSHVHPVARLWTAVLARRVY